MFWDFHTECQKVTDRQAHMRAHIGCIRVEAAVQIKSDLYINISPFSLAIPRVCLRCDSIFRGVDHVCV